MLLEKNFPNNSTCFYCRFGKYLMHVNMAKWTP